jgi:PAS domain S-box-containing protein
VESWGVLGPTEAEEDEDRLQRIVLDRLPALISYWDRDLRNVLANEGFVEWFGLTPHQLRGRHLGEVLGEQALALNAAHLEAVLAGEEQIFDRTITDAQGRTRHVQTSYSPDDVEGDVRGFFVLVVDVTARVEAQRAMEEAQALAHVGNWELDVGTGKVTFSDELYRIFGYRPGEVEPDLATLRGRVHPDDLARVDAIRERATELGEGYSVDYRVRHPDGTVVEVHSMGRPVRDESGTVVRLTGTLQDVTEVNRAGRELARINTELIQLNELNADVLGMLGHDVRGPLSVVLGYLEELDEDWSTSTETMRRRHVATARAAADRLRTLVDDILALASLESGAIAPEASDHDLALLVAEALTVVPGQADVAIEGERGLKVWCDAFHVRQIVANLAGNALRYGAPPVVVSLEGGDATAQVTVSDRGPGVPEEFVPELFDRFARGPDRHAARGAGLGLYIARRLAEANEGTLEYSTGPDGRGAVFTLTIPRVG